jgi:predicted nucleotidyltransferase
MIALESDVCTAISDWAESTPRVRRVWLFGSRAGDTYRDECDIDIALEIEPVGDSEETLAVWMVNSEKWQAQLQQHTNLEVDLEWFDPDGSTPKVHHALREASILLYDRAL